MIDLLTREGENLPDIPWDVYPRPRMRRDSFFCLNGRWELAVTDGEAPTAADNVGEIRVPFPPESLLSGIHRRFSESETLWYTRTFTLPTGFRGDRVLLHFGAVDQSCTVCLNGVTLGSHVGGYTPFSFDVTHALREENTLVVSVTDRLSDTVLPYGKQRQKRGGMWYTPVSGIWQTVWLESVPEDYIRTLSVEILSLNSVRISVSGVADARIAVEGLDRVYETENGSVILTLDAPQLWTPETPHLYRFTVESECDRVSSYFALRTVTCGEHNGVPRLLLNEKPYFFHGVLDQGYYSDGIFTPASPVLYENDIKTLKSLGFNMLRKHIKIEPELFYYTCDCLGIAVFQDMVNNGHYSFFRDTALPTVGIRRLPDIFHNNKETRDAFLTGMEDTVRYLSFFPSVVYWTVFNEGWGQFCGSDCYHRLRALDATRVIDTASGWFSGVSSDVDSRHVYFRKPKLRVGKKPLVLSECGGFSYVSAGHVYDPDHAFGYAKCETREDFVRMICDLYENGILPLVRAGLSAAVLTQLSDVEDETNGILSYDRRILKITPAEFASLSRQLTDAGKT